MVSTIAGVAKATSTGSGASDSAYGYGILNGSFAGLRATGQTAYGNQTDSVGHFVFSDFSTQQAAQAVRIQWTIGMSGSVSASAYAGSSASSSLNNSHSVSVTLPQP